MSDLHTPKLDFPAFLTSPFQVAKPQGPSLTRSPAASHPVFSQSLWPIFQTSSMHRPLPSPPPPTHSPTVTSQHISLPLLLPPSFPPQQPGRDAFKTQVRPHPSASHSSHLTHNRHQSPQTLCSVLWDPSAPAPPPCWPLGLRPPWIFHRLSHRLERSSPSVCVPQSSPSEPLLTSLSPEVHPESPFTLGPWLCLPSAPTDTLTLL